MLFGGLIHGWAQDPSQEEFVKTAYKIKASMLYRFVKYVEWPSEFGDLSELTIGIVGDDPFQGAFEPVENSRYLGKTLRIHRFGSYHADLDFTRCQVLFISVSERANINTILTKTRGKMILIVTEGAEAPVITGMVNFRIQGDQVLYELNPANAAANRLRFTTSMLKYAHVIY
ncbi:YfiR family protein [Acanthopleuribacter pedis]